MNTARLAAHRPARRHPQLGDAHGAEAHPHDRRLRAAQLRLQLLRHGRLEPRRVRGRAQDDQGGLARPARRDGAGRGGNPEGGGSRHEDPRADRQGSEPRQVHRLPHLLGDLQERLDQPRGRRIRLVQQRRDQARHRLSQGLGEPEALERRLGAQRQRPHPAEAGREVAHPRQHLRQSRPAGDRRLLRAVHLRLRPPAVGAGDAELPHRPAALADYRRADGEDRMGAELGGDPRRRVREALEGLQLRRGRRRRSTASSRTAS